jgi:hypothetical protein
MKRAFPNSTSEFTLGLFCRLARGFDCNTNIRMNLAVYFSDAIKIGFKQLDRRQAGGLNASGRFSERNFP